MDQAPLRQDTIAASPYASLGEGLEAAEMARNRGDNLAALQIFAELREQFPEHPAPHLRPVAILSQLRRFDEAERLLADESPLVRGAAVWALALLTTRETFEAHASQQQDAERDDSVRQEWLHARVDAAQRASPTAIVPRGSGVPGIPEP